MVGAYLSLLDPPAKSAGAPAIVTPVQQYRYYWLGHDLVTRLLLPTINMLLWRDDIILPSLGLSRLHHSHCALERWYVRDVGPSSLVVAISCILADAVSALHCVWEEMEPA